MKLQMQSIVLPGEKVILRPMTENDWAILFKWNNDPEILYFNEGDNISSYTLEEVQQIYRSVSQNAFCFIIEYHHKPVGECWLQQMNLERILKKYPDRECRRIDLMIGEKSLWGTGFGTDTISVLTQFGFGNEQADYIFGCDIADYNRRSLRAFEKNGYQICAKIQQPIGEKAKYTYDVVLSADRYHREGRAVHPLPV